MSKYKLLISNQEVTLKRKSAFFLLSSLSMFHSEWKKILLHLVLAGEGIEFAYLNLQITR